MHNSTTPSIQPTHHIRCIEGRLICTDCTYTADSRDAETTGKHAWTLSDHLAHSDYLTR